MTPRKIARFLALLLAALSAGVFFGTKASLGPSTKGFAPKTYVEVQQATVRNLRPVMGALLPGAVAANLAVLALSLRERRSPAFALTLAGFLCQLTSLVVTGLFELPINARVMTWSPEDPPEGWEALRDRWDAFHTVRTATSVAGLGCLVAAAQGSPPAPGVPTHPAI
jgi:uncharacterized membrane protein